jgi:hypothetical protein
MHRCSISLFILAITVTAGNADILKREPPMGALQEGQIVLVDDGTCPSGQIKRVVGGNHVKVGGTKHIVRTHSCVAR